MVRKRKYQQYWDTLFHKERQEPKTKEQKSGFHWRRIELEDKAKVVASVCGAKFVQFLDALAVLPFSTWKNRMNSTISSKLTAKQLAQQGIEQNLPPKQTRRHLPCLLVPSFFYGGFPTLPLGDFGWYTLYRGLGCEGWKRSTHAYGCPNSIIHGHLIFSFFHFFSDTMQAWGPKVGVPFCHNS